MTALQRLYTSRSSVVKSIMHGSVRIPRRSLIADVLCWRSANRVALRRFQNELKPLRFARMLPCGWARLARVQLQLQLIQCARLHANATVEFLLLLLYFCIGQVLLAGPLWAAEAGHQRRTCTGRPVERREA